MDRELRARYRQNATREMPRGRHCPTSRRSGALSWVSARWRFCLPSPAVACFLLLAIEVSGPNTIASAQEIKPSEYRAVVVELEGTAETMPGSNPPWTKLQLGGRIAPGDRVRVSANSRLVLQLPGRSTARFSPGAEFVMDPPATPQAKSGLTLLRGLLYLFHRDEPMEGQFRSRTVSAAIRGTEFVFEARDDGSVILSLIDGAVELSSPGGTTELQSGERGAVIADGKPIISPLVEVHRTVQWCLYFPSVIDPAELHLTAADQTELGDSLNAYVAGDVRQAVALRPPLLPNSSPTVRVYHAALALTVGQVDEAESLLGNLPPDPSTDRLARALQILIASVSLQPAPERAAPATASEWLAESYYLQSQTRLTDALRAARNAVEQSPSFGFGWSRRAELEFSFGRTRAADRALANALRLAPRQAPALTLRGFILSADNRIADALKTFDEAIAMDGAIGNAWLGRGLCRMRRGETELGQQDIQVAATLEPQRAILRSYLGKAYSERGDMDRAAREILLAQQLDPNDPTGWLYSGLLAQQENRITSAIADLEKSTELHRNRQLYRSQLLLEQDRAVQGANLASALQDAGLPDVALREAGRAVAYDYANASAHLFLANSFNQLRDPNQVNLRYETAWFSEFLLANLLAPVGAGRLSQTLSQQEYSKLFERDRFGVASSTEYYSHGEWYQTVVQHGTFGDTSYAAEGFHHSSDGFRPDSELRQDSLSLRLKEQLTPRDGLFAQIAYYHAKSGDVTPYYDDAAAIPGYRHRETQEPALLVGLHHEWAPGLHTLGLASWVRDRVDVLNPLQSLLRVSRNLSGTIDDAFPVFARLDYRAEQDLAGGELQQIWQNPWGALQFGGRYQTGEFHTHSHQDRFLSPLPGVTPQAPQTFSTDFNRASAYAYGQWPILLHWWLVGGVSFDRVTYPVNFQAPPLTNRTATAEKVSPKAGIIWTPTSATTWRGGFTRGLGGVSLDQSYRLEPSQVAGFNQAFRSIIPEAAEGQASAADLESWDLSIEQKIGARTYLGATAQRLESDVGRVLGVIENGPIGPPGPIVPRGDYPAGTRQSLDYREQTLALSGHHLVGDWAFGAQYRLSVADLRKEWRDIPAAAAALGGFPRREHLEATLHQTKLFATYHHASGFFGRFESIWSQQSNQGYTVDRPGDEFWHFNLWAGWRLAKRRVELEAGILNLTDQNYRLNPLNLTAQLPRERTLFLAARFAF